MRHFTFLLGAMAISVECLEDTVMSIPRLLLGRGLSTDTVQATLQTLVVEDVVDLNRQSIFDVAGGLFLAEKLAESEQVDASTAISLMEDVFNARCIHSKGSLNICLKLRDVATSILLRAKGKSGSVPQWTDLRALGVIRQDVSAGY